MILLFAIFDKIRHATPKICQYNLLNNAAFIE